MSPRPQSRCRSPRPCRLWRSNHRPLRASLRNNHSQTGQQSTNESNLDRDQVKQVQEALNQKGFKSGQADGKMGPETKDALQAFQQKQGLQATGQPDQQTLAALGINEAGTTGQAPAARAPAAKAPPVRARPI